jgi:type VI protein secretion system component Hcp
MTTKRRIAINDLPTDYLHNVSQEEQARIAGGIELENVLISNYSVSGSSAGSALSTETISLSFDKIQRL